MNREGWNCEVWSDPAHEDFQRRLGAALDRFHDNHLTIEHTPATTIPGLLAKIAALGLGVRSAVIQSWDETVENDGSFHELLAMSIVRDAARGVRA